MYVKICRSYIVVEKIKIYCKYEIYIVSFFLIKVTYLVVVNTPVYKITSSGTTTVPLSNVFHRI